MTQLRFIFGDQLSLNISSLRHCDKKRDIVFMCEVYEEVSHIKHHKKKIAFIFAAMRHFKETLQEQGYHVIYIKLEKQPSKSSFESTLTSIIKDHSISKIIVTEPSEFRVYEKVNLWEKLYNIKVIIENDDRFLCTHDEFKSWAMSRQLRMEHFYRTMRKKHSILMDNGKPTGGQWNYDSENRKPPKKGLDIPPPFYQEPDKITKEVMKLVQKRFSHHFGDLEPFYFAVTHQQAEKALNNFIDKRLALFGDYQDAMIEKEPWMFHSHISFYLNCGLLSPMDCITKAESAYQNGLAPLNAVEGFIRQILGWREYIRGIYWLKMPEYENLNFFNANRNLPDFFWSAKTPMNCLKQCIQETKENAYAHHIQRLMILGNFCLLAGIHPNQVNEWYHIVYADAYQWVELPNVSGMILFADGGLMASKPYAAGGSYINKMSNYCKNCTYKVKEKVGEEACPFNYLYWNFLDKNRQALEKNPRIGIMYRSYDRMSKNKQLDIHKSSQNFLNKLNEQE